MSEELVKREDNAPATPEQLADYEAKCKAQAEAKFPASYNTIKVCYDDESPDKGKLILFNQGETEHELLGESFVATILAVRHQYIHYPMDENGYVDKEEILKTDMFEDFNEPVNIYKGGILHAENVDHVSQWIKANCPDAKYRDILYLDYKGTVYMLVVKGASCGPWFDFKNEMQNRLFFEYETQFGVTKAKKGSVTYYPLTFKQSKLHGEKEYKVFLAQSFDVSKMIQTFNDPNPNATKEEQEKDFKEMTDEEKVEEVDKVFGN